WHVAEIFSSQHIKPIKLIFMKNISVQIDPDSIKIINEDERILIQEIPSTDLPKVGKKGTSVLIEELFYNGLAPCRVMYMVAFAIQEVVPDNQIDWVNTFLPIEHWEIQIRCFMDQDPESLWYLSDDDEIIERKMNELVKKNLRGYSLIPNE
ncbi:MAG: hypothetical protein R6U40_12625, partial [Desulfobacterales bacterium]